MAQVSLIVRNGTIEIGLARLQCSRHSGAQEAERTGHRLLSSSVGIFPSLKSGSIAKQRSSFHSTKTFALFGSKPAKDKTAGKKPEKLAKTLTEDGIFGTSGGIGFTKQNELFVGRVAMIGFAASILGEALTGKGTLAQFDIETGIPLNETEPLLLFFILFTLLGAIGALGDRGKFVDDSAAPVITAGKGLKGALGLNEKGPTFGFTKANELFVGRMAQLGIAFSIIGEIITGKGTLAQLNIETGVPITELEPLIIFNVIFFFVAAINPGTGRFISDNEEE